MGEKGQAGLRTMTEQEQLVEFWKAMGTVYRALRELVKEPPDTYYAGVIVGNLRTELEALAERVNREHRATPVGEGGGR